MTKDVIISIMGKQSDDDGDESIELVTSGTMSENEGTYKISYFESEMTGLEGTTTTFEVKDKSVVLSRAGAVNSQMVFEEGRKHLSLYDLGFASMTVGVAARRVSSALSENGGSIEVDYAIEIDHAMAGFNEFKISVKTAGETGGAGLVQ